MQKLKTKKTLLRRIKISKNGKLIRRKIGLKHLKVNLSGNHKRRSSAMSTFENRKIRGRFKKMLGSFGKNL